MTERLNKGEWSEFYAFLKILSDKGLRAANSDLTPGDTFFAVRKVLRGDRVYSLACPDKITLKSPGGLFGEETEIPYELVRESLPGLLAEITAGSGTFEAPTAAELMQTLKIENLKASADQKGDIKVVVRDPLTGADHEVEFSIKSYIGGSPTLLNASKATNFVFRLDGFSGSASDINGIDGRSKVRDRVEALRSAGTEFTALGASAQTFSRNLRRIDSLLPQICAQALLQFYSGRGSSLSDLVKYIAKHKLITDVTGVPFDEEDLKYKFKQLLINVALGMFPNKTWDGFLRADGGYIIVRPDGNQVCFHIHNIAELGEYLFQQTKFETASTTRHKFATVYKNAGQYYMDLNLQIRFKG